MTIKKSKKATDAPNAATKAGAKANTIKAYDDDIIIAAHTAIELATCLNDASDEEVISHTRYISPGHQITIRTAESEQRIYIVAGVIDVSDQSDCIVGQLRSTEMRTITLQSNQVYTAENVDGGNAASVILNNIESNEN